MKKTICLLAALISHQCFADENLAPLLNRVSLQLKAWQWVTTTTAAVDVTVNAVVNDKGVETLQHSVMQKLQSLSDKNTWHMLAFNRQQDKSGLETIQIQAEIRLPQTELNGLRDKTKNLSRPGETYTIDNIAFTPSEDELKEAANSLRANLYQQVKTEIDALNKNFPTQKYYLHQIDFTSQPSLLPQMQNMYMAKMANARVAAAPMAVGNKQEVIANVVLASMPEPVVQKLAASQAG